MKKIIIAVMVCCLLGACSHTKKPPLAPTQIVDGKSIIIPPEFDVVPEEPIETPAETQKEK